MTSATARSRLRSASQWRTTTIGAICEEFGGSVQTGPFGSQLHAADYSSEGTPVVMPQDIHDGRIVVSRIARVSSEHVKRLDRHILEPGDILFSRRGDVSRFAIVTEAERGWLCGTGSIRIRLNCPHIRTDYVRNYLRQPIVGDWLARHAKGVTMPNLNTAVVRALPISCPPPPEQKRIAAILDAAEALREKRRDVHARLDSLTQSIFGDMFDNDPRTDRCGWSYATVAELAAPRPFACVGGPFGSELTQADYVTDPGVPVIRGQNIATKSPFLYEDGYVFVSERKALRLDRNTAVSGDVVVSQRGACLAGQVALIPQASRFQTYVVSQSQMKVTPDANRIEPLYLVYFFRSKDAVRRMQSRMISTGVPHINLQILRDFSVLVPPLVLQRDFARRVSAVEKSKASHRASLAELDALVASLQNRAFRGEL